MTPDRIILGVMGCLMLKWIAEAQMDKLRCAYCGGVRQHKQNCPHDFEQRR